MKDRTQITRQWGCYPHFFLSFSFHLSYFIFYFMLGVNMSNNQTKFHLAFMTALVRELESRSAGLADKGINLIIHGRDPERLQKVAEELSKKVKVDIINAVLGNEAGRSKVVDLIHNAKPDLVVNDAGFGLSGDALTYDTSQQMDVMNVNANAVLEISLEAARTMRSENKKGVVLNVSSAAAFPIFPCMSVYSAAKAFVNQFSESFDEEMREHGIRILSACPGMVNTGFKSRAGGSSGPCVPIV